MAVATPPPPTITIKDAADRLGVHENTIRNWIDRQLLRAYRLPSGHRRLARSDVERMAEEMWGAPSSLPDVDVSKAPKAEKAQPLTSALP